MVLMYLNRTLFASWPVGPVWLFRAGLSLFCSCLTMLRTTTLKGPSQPN
ncbi:hypothetical protein [Adhaeribacter arboris]|nr:hypothetical protein [Adhaeribacter arboris]